MSEDSRTDQTGRRPRRLGRIGPLIAVVGALVGGVLGGAGGLAIAAGGPWHHGPRLERIQARVARALDAVGATSAQESRVHDIVASSFGSATEDRTAREAMHKQMLDLLKAPTIDRGAVEKLRADEVARFDARSKALVSALLEAADQLSPAQRTALAARAEQMMAHRDDTGEGWRRHRPEGPPDRHRPDDGPGDDPSKG